MHLSKGFFLWAEMWLYNLHGFSSPLWRSFLFAMITLDVCRHLNDSLRLLVFQWFHSYLSAYCMPGTGLESSMKGERHGLCHSVALSITEMSLPLTPLGSLFWLRLWWSSHSKKVISRSSNWSNVKNLVENPRKFVKDEWGQATF